MAAVLCRPPGRSSPSDAAVSRDIFHGRMPPSVEGFYCGMGSARTAHEWGGEWLVVPHFPKRGPTWGCRLADSAMARIRLALPRREGEVFECEAYRAVHSPGFTNAPPHVAYQPCARSPGKRAPMLCGGGGSDDALSRCWERRILSWDSGTQVPTRGADWAWVGCLDVHAPPHNRGPVELAHCVLPKSSSTACRPPVCYEPTGARRWCDRSEQFRARELPLGHGTLESRTHVADTCGLLPSHRWRCTAQGEMGVLAPCRAHTGKGVRVGRGVCRSKWRRTFV
jgi:hypothetical protein